GRSVVVVLAEDDIEALSARETLEDAGAESLDAARDMWWIGLRETEQESYERQGAVFSEDEALYRRGFEAAMKEGDRDKSGCDGARVKGDREGGGGGGGKARSGSHGKGAVEPAFGRGFERGCLYRDTRLHHPEVS